MAEPLLHVMILIIASMAGALLGSARIASPCSLTVAASVCKEAADELLLRPGGVTESELQGETERGSSHWVAVLPPQRGQRRGAAAIDERGGGRGFGPADAALLRAPPSIQSALGLDAAGKPLAVGRLRRPPGGALPVLDCLRSTVPKEEPRALESLELVLDALLLAWASQLVEEGRPGSYEELRAAGSVFAAPALASRGFVDLIDPDFTALSRREPLATHQARLPAALFAAKARATALASAVGTDECEKDLALRLVTALLALEPPAAAVEPDRAPTKDPFAGCKGFGLA